MKNFVAALVVVLLVGSTAFGHGWYVGYGAPVAVGPAPVVAYYPGPVVAPVVRVPARYYAASPVVVPAPVYATPVTYEAPVYAAPVYGGAVYAAPVVVHPKFYVPGQPVRNVLRAVTP